MEKEKQPEWYDDACREAVRMYMNKNGGKTPDCAEMAEICWGVFSGSMNQIRKEVLTTIVDHLTKSLDENPF